MSILNIMQDILFDKSLFVNKNTSDIQEHYKVVGILGQGAFSVVYKAIHRKTGLNRCIKKIKIKSFTKAEEESIMNEIEILKMIDHPHIMKIYEYYQKENYLYIVTEFLAGGELFYRIEQLNKFTESAAAKYIRQILLAVSYLHARQIIHRDIKPENVVFETPEPDSNLKLIDFGTSKKLLDNKKLKTTMGTAYYVAPEVLNKSYDFKCDVWSCGVILYVLLCGYPPFNGSTEQKIIKRIKEGKFVFPDEEWSHISNEAKDLIKLMLTRNPDKRPSVEQVLKHPWFSKVNKVDVDLHAISLVFKKLEKFDAKQKLRKAICLYFVNFFDIAKEKEDLLKTFKQMDVKCNGVLTRQELIDVYSKMYDKTTAEKLVDDIIKAVDFDKSNTINFSEFLAANIDYQKALNNQKLRQIFDILDANNTGTISPDELKAFLNIQGDNDGTLVNQIMSEVDKNGDGLIQFEEFLEMMDGFYKKL